MAPRATEASATGASLATSNGPTGSSSIDVWDSTLVPIDLATPAHVHVDESPTEVDLIDDVIDLSTQAAASDWSERPRERADEVVYDLTLTDDEAVVDDEDLQIVSHVPGAPRPIQPRRISGSPVLISDTPAPFRRPRETTFSLADGDLRAVLRSLMSRDLTPGASFLYQGGPREPRPFAAVPPPQLPPLGPPEDPAAIKCAICLDVFGVSTKLCATQCGHVFCEGCITDAKKVNNKCPVCRKVLGKKPLIRLFF
ncbi:hypothetical protein HKX48_004573 [Thoreauomyces humboldtii]|nr:hypothetical protein HKX48_004573 [Thoreauomyces humboldtii]